MTDLFRLVSDLRRPALLVRAARAGLMDYNRRRDLKRVMRTAEVPQPEAAVSALLQEEERLEDIRRKGDATYSFARHIDVLIAMIAEARLLPRPV
ncbi:DUF6477 family protein [Frigidibacter sp. RF13]|uniref:DUF6477 family protein n=1 Tax=Frigidibacter sp. RF13 TaxID=2997340 RepID=UPI00226D7575|nr:DUF6477 family protein [Frigidibacter sp. RF13]MCY1125517.1 DUF6477 family protein [Frigidibacter sp. RF13]